MLKRTITYEDFNGTQRTEDFYFNLTEAEIAKLELGITGGLSEMLKKLAATQDQPAIIKIFEDFVLTAYGEKSADGRRFMKTPEIREAFAQTPAYSILFMELAFDADKASAFINGVIPAHMSKQIESAAAVNN